jgi:molybdopterin synthase catalytic subunit
VSVVTARLYAGVRERAGVAELTVEGADVAAVREALAAACPAIAEQLAFCRFAVDDEFVGDDAAVGAGATVDVIPPVSGG